MSLKMLRHVVLFHFKQKTSAETIKEIEEHFCALPVKIPCIHDFEWGTDVSTGDRAMGFTHCFILTFKSTEDLNRYLPHPEHMQFKEILGPHLEKSCVLDYWVK